MAIDDLLSTGTVVLDGGLSTALEERGHDLSGRLWSAQLLRQAPSEIIAAHRGFVDAGADVVISASYQASYFGYASAGLTEEQCDADLDASIQLAREGADGRALVAASVGPYGAALADGSEYTGYSHVGRRTLRDFHARRLERLVAADPDLVAVETIPEIDEADVVVDLLGEIAPDVPYWVSFSAAQDGRLTGGAPFAEAIEVVRGSAVAVGVNCTAPEHIEELLGSVTASVPYVVYPNSGASYDPATKTWTDDTSAESWHFSPEVLRRWQGMGAALIGGCCGISADGIREIASAVRA
ncbi:MAG: homocysteine S-methyltransferase [Knoellia sp.]